MLLLPWLQFAVSYVLRARTVNGLPSALAVATVDGAVTTLIATVSDPVRGVLSLVLVAVLSRLAFGRRSRR